MNCGFSIYQVNAYINYSWEDGLSFALSIIQYKVPEQLGVQTAHNLCLEMRHSDWKNIGNTLAL